MATAIWKDTYINGGALYSSFVFQIKYNNGQVIYQGVAQQKSNTSDIKIKINDICADYLYNTLPACSDVEFVESPNIVNTFYVYDITNSRTLGSVTFINDWSYDRSFDHSSAVLLSDPIRKSFAKGQILYIAYENAPATITGTIYLADGSTATISEPRSANADLNNDFNNDFFTSNVDVGEIGTLAINMAHYPDAVKLEIGGMTFVLAEGCQRYVLHYTNAYGGWDSIWMSSGVITDTFTRKTIQRLYDNSTASARGKVNFANPYTKKWQLHTGYLFAEDGEKMHHLLGSTNVYLQDMTEGEMLPVTITDNSCEYKSYRSNGGKLVDFTINCELAQDRRRL